MRNKIIIFLIGIITFTGIGISKSIASTGMKCESYIDICPSGQVNPNTGACTGGAKTFCNKYKDEALKCIDSTKMTYVKKGQVPYEDKSCGWAGQCERKAEDVECRPGEWAEKADSNTPDCEDRWFGPYYEWECCHKVTKYKEGFVIGEIDVCTQWDINVKFGNVKIDPNFIEF